jgi:predicted 2-oxoglutarate/Fe(II)-dependent dioxygenase YbiX
VQTSLPAKTSRTLFAAAWVAASIRACARLPRLIESRIAETGRSCWRGWRTARLRARLGECPELVGLSGHYHNLLRQWSKV